MNAVESLRQIVKEKIGDDLLVIVSNREPYIHRLHEGKVVVDKPASGLVTALDADNIHCTDLNPKNIGTDKHGAEISDGRTDTEKLIIWCDVVLATSSTIVNATYDDIKTLADTHGKRLIIFGVTGAGVAALLGLERLCFQPH